MDKVSLKNPKDQNFETHQEKVFNVVEKAAINAFKDKYFHEEYRGVFLLALILKFISNLVSFCTGFIALNIATKLFFGENLSLFFSFSICIGFELLKTFLWKINSKKYLKYKQVSKIIICSLVALHFISLGFSAYGGWMLPSLVDPVKQETVPEIKKDSISKTYLAAIAVIDGQLKKNYEGMKKVKGSNSTLRTFNDNVRLLLSQKEAKETALNLAILKAEEARQQKVQEFASIFLGAKLKRNEEIRTARVSCLFASLFFELLFIACACFSVFYLYRLNVDLEAPTEDERSNNNADETVLTDPTKNIPKPTSTQEAHEAPPLVDNKPPTEIQKIGFKQNDRLDSKKSSLEDKTSICLDDKTSICLDSKECALPSCSETWTGGKHNKKFCSDNCRKLAYQIRKHDTKKPRS